MLDIKCLSYNRHASNASNHMFDSKYLTYNPHVLKCFTSYAWHYMIDIISLTSNVWHITLMLEMLYIICVTSNAWHIILTLEMFHILSVTLNAWHIIFMIELSHIICVTSNAWHQVFDMKSSCLKCFTLYAWHQMLDVKCLAPLCMTSNASQHLRVITVCNIWFSCLTSHMQQMGNDSIFPCHVNQKTIIYFKKSHG